MSIFNPTFIGHFVVGLATAFNGLAWLVLTFVAHLKAERRHKDGGAGRNDHRALCSEDGYPHNSWLSQPCALRLQIDPICRFPKKTGQTLFALAYWMEGVMLMVLIGTCGRSMLSVHGVYFILALSAYGCALAATARIFIPTEVFIVNLALSVSLIFQGTWFVVIGFILQYGQDKIWWWAEKLSVEHEHTHLTLTTLTAAWLQLCNVTVVLMLWDLVTTLNHCRIKVLHPLVREPGLSTCFKEKLSTTTAVTQTEEVLHIKHAKLTERGTAVVVDDSKETEANGGADGKAVIADIPKLVL